MNLEIFNQIPLYRFLQYCENAVPESETKTILDCGAGGCRPPLSLFYAYGYKTIGIDLESEQVESANAYGHQNQQSLNIIEGDMTDLKFEDASFDFVYSYNSIFHMKKVQIKKAIQEMKRVLKPGGLMFVNFLSVDDFRCGEGPDLGDHQYEQMDDEPVIHAYFDYDEAEPYFEDMTFVLKERRVIERIYEGERIQQGFIDYILKK
ncbi:class I SAM-dependent methyltransferase [Fusibacter sp. 3D3]|uniref:class I SAM-dependent methyltransferase n=1 Tax=Fusibacter sp. 3D3 TaxID=1048380 RepID=UPI00085310BD|nr:class I SAM-dependent methyltransferase [Fusibacter sp. 3D3]GAU79978.1 S-adenosylmethionine-dependent methyltransferase [Fusibacter sp. 3D3]